MGIPTSHPHLSQMQKKYTQSRLTQIATLNHVEIIQKKKKEGKVERKYKWEMWKKTKAMLWKKTSTNYSKWDYYTDSEEEK